MNNHINQISISLFYPKYIDLIQFINCCVYFDFLSQLITKMNHSPFIINLTRQSQGYIFHSLQEQTSPPIKPKKSKPLNPRPPQNRNTNRLIKQIGLISDAPQISQPEPQPQREGNVGQQDLGRLQAEATLEEEQVDYQIKRLSAPPPSPCEWFELESIHPLEQQSFPEFYTGRSYKTPQLFKSYRNFIVEVYRRNPRRYLSFVSCRRVLRGDSTSLLKIYNFLVDEGIINYCIHHDGNYSFKPQANDKVSELSKRPQSSIRKLPDRPQKDKVQMDTDNLTVTVINKNFSRTFRVYCVRCKLVCGIVWYTSQDDNNNNLCFQCYNKNPDPKQYLKVDILKKMETSKDSRQNTSKSSWGLDDNIKLLDFMGNCEGKSWRDLVNQFDGKKALQDIIIQFMQFPITNFDPHSSSVKLKHQTVEAKHDEHIDMLMRLYNKSPIASNGIKQQQRKQQNQQYSGHQAPLFRTYSNLILQKYMNKIESLKRMENTIDQTALNIYQQPLSKKIKLNVAQPYQQSDDLADYVEE